MTTRARSQATSRTAAVPARTLQRACACGESVDVSGKCPACTAGERLRAPPGLRVNRLGDHWEQEADRIAEEVVSARPSALAGPLPATPPVQRRAVEEEAEEGQARRGFGGEPAMGDEDEEPQRKAAAGGSGRVTGAAEAAVASGGRPLSSAARADFEPRFGRDFSAVRIHDDAGAGEAARSIDARAFTLGHHIAFAPGEFAPETLEGRRLMAHELAHTLQQETGHAAAPRLTTSALVQRQPDSLGALPEATRESIQVSTTPIIVPPARISAFFTLNANGRHGETQSISDTTPVFGAGIDAALQTGLGSLGAWIATSANALPMNMTIEVELDLSAHGGAARRYRFTRFMHQSGRGSSATSTPVLLVEDVGPAVAVPAQANLPSNITVGTNSFNLRGNWSNSAYAQLHQAIGVLPPQAQAAANGLNFRRRSGNAPGIEAGHYDPSTDTVELYDDAFPASSVRLGGHSLAVRNILHEIGHALDLRPLEAAWQAFNAAGQSRSARGTLLAERSPSGTRWVRDESGDFSQETEASDRSPGFRRAVRRDGVGDESQQRTTPEGTTATLRQGVTTYSDTDYQELYAESFMLYVSAPDALRTLRPNTFDFFQRNFPRSTP